MEARAGLTLGWLLAGWLLASVRVVVPALASDEATFRARIPGSLAEAPAVRELARWSPRELRALPGIGEARAVAIAQACWEHGRLEIEDLDSVPTIGEGTVERIREWLKRDAEP